MKYINRISFYSIATVIACGAALVSAQDVKDTQVLSHDEAYRRNLTIFNALTRELEENYVDSIRPEEAFKGAIEGMLATVDPYTEYYSYDDRESLERLTTGSYGGIGAFITSNGVATFISEPITGSPAFKAGLKPGDHILKVDSTDVSGFKSDAVSKLLRGQQGTTVNVRVSRPYVGADSILDFTLMREKVAEPPVPWSGVLNGNIGYVKLNQFVESSGPDVRAAIDSLKGNPEVKYMILDLRGNGGGLVESAIDILSNFLPKGTEVLRTKGKNSRNEKIYKTQRTPTVGETPLAVLIDGGSASASEITAGALQDLDRAVLIGSRSFGKGLVQGTRPLPYNALLKVTQGKYYLPSGRLLQALDYSHRNPDGSVARTPDSLTNVYRTRIGREVRDGGGLTPDSTIDWGNNSALIYGLIVGNHIFNYANKYAATHPAPADIATFTLSDEDFEEFASGIDAKNFKYDKLCNQIIDNLRQAAEAEGYMSPEVKASIDALEKQLDHDLKSDIYTKRPQIEEYLTEEIAARYWPGYGRARRELVNDKAVEMATKIFTTPGLYKKILSAQNDK
ncbi:MAG: S41 family peptidase [Muribaculaceae bacterium]|nr:S41 family peptidase [Muribaculaceae bacterium]